MGLPADDSNGDVAVRRLYLFYSFIGERCRSCHQRADPPVRHAEGDLRSPAGGGERTVALPYRFPVLPDFPLPLFLVLTQLPLLILVREAIFNNMRVLNKHNNTYLTC